VAILDELTTGLDPQARRETWQLVSQVRDRGVTILLVTHLMDEAERLCDRIAVIHRGRVAAIDTPARLTARAATGQVLRFATATPADTGALKALDSVSTLEHNGTELAVTGNGAVLTEVVAELARQHVTPLNLRIEQPNLDDAFLMLTGESLTGEGK
jgi:ABC-2 type transport system ATP-binding protein